MSVVCLYKLGFTYFQNFLDWLQSKIWFELNAIFKTNSRNLTRKTKKNSYLTFNYILCMSRNTRVGGRGVNCLPPSPKFLAG